MVRFYLDSEEVATARIPTDKGLDKNSLSSSECYVLDCKVRIEEAISHFCRMKFIIGWVKSR
jgi:hypothetical protein